MEHRYNYFQQNPNSLVNGQSTFNRSFMDGTQSTNNYSGSISSTSSQDQSLFRERNYTNPNAVPLMNSHSYQMDSSNQPPHSSGPPRTNAKGIYENSQSSISNVQNLAQSNSENYPNSPDFQLQPHLTSLLPQQSKSVPEFYPVEKYNTNRGSIAANMNINYFSSNKSYPEPKIIEYDIEETSTDSSPQHTSSLYSESTDQDSESIHANNVLSKQNTEYLATYDSKTTSFNKQFPAPIQFADLSLKSNSNDDHQHSILHSAYNQSDDDIIEDIPLSDNTNENEIDSKLENQEIPILRNNEQSFNTIKIQKFDCYGNKNDFGQTEFNYENKLGEPSNLSIKNNQPPYSVMNSNVQNNTPYLSQSNTLTQSHSLDYSTSETLQHKSIFPYSNTNVFNYQPKPPSVQNFNDGLKSGNYNQQNKSINHIFQSSNDSSVNSKLQSNNINSNTQDKIILNHSTSQAQVLNDQNSCQSINSSANVYNQHDLQSKEFISQQSINSSSKSSATELLSNSQQSTTYSSLLASTQSIPITSSVKVESSVSSSSAFEAIVQESQNTPYQMSKDQTLYNLPIDNTTNSLNLNQDFPNTVKPEIDIKLSQSSSNNLNENNQDTIINQSNSINKQLEENQQNSVLLPSPTIEHFTQSSNFFNSKNNTVQQDTNFQQSSRNKFTSQQAFFNNDIKSLSDQFPNNSNSSVSHSISNQNITLSQPLTTTGHSTSHYFNSVNTNNQSVFNQQPLTVKSNNQQQNIPTQDDIKPIVSSFQFLDKSNIHNTPVNLLSSIHQSPLIKTEMDLTENCIVDSNALPKETTTLTSTVTSQNVESLLTQSKNINDDLKQNNEDMSNSSQASNNIPNDQFSNMTIDNQMHNQTFNQEQNIPSYLLKTKSLDKEENPTVLQNTFSTIHDTSNPKSELLNTNNSIQSSTNKQINPLDLNQSTAYESSPLSINSQTLPTEKSIVQPLKNTFSSEQFNNKETSNAVSLGTNQSSPQLFSNQLKSHAISSPSTSTNQCLTQSFNNHNLSTSNVVSPVSSFDNQLPVQVYKSQLKSDTVSSNQSVPNVTLPSSSVAHQFPSQMFSNQPNSGSMQPTSFALNQYSSKLFNNQSTQNTIPVSSPITNQFQSQMFNTQAKPDTLSPLQPAASEYPIQSFSNQSNQNTVSSVTSVGNQLPSQVFSNQSKPGVMSSLQPATNPCPGQLFDNQPTVNSNPQVSFSASQLSSQTLDNQHNLVASSFQTIPNQYPSQPFNNQSRPNIVPPIPSSTKLPPMMLGNEIKSDVPRLQSTINQYPSQPFNTHPTSSLVPPVLSTTKLPPQIYSNQPKSDVPTPLPTSSQYSLQPTSNTPSVPLVTNQFSSEFSNQYKPNNLPFQSTPNQYLSQSSNNQLRQNIIPPLSTENQLPPQKLSIQPSVDIGLSNKPMANRYPSQPINNQPLPGFPPVQQTTNKYPSQQFNNQPGQQQVPPPQNKKFYNQTYPTQPTHNQWPTHSNVNQMSQQLSTPVSAANFSNQVNPMFTQPTLNPSSNLTTFPPNVNQQTQRLGSQVLAPNSISSNSYYNQAQGNTNVQQSQPSKIFSDQNVQLPLKGYPQQSNNMGYSNQINYQQSNAVYGQQDPYRPEQNSVVQQGFSKTWGYDNVDLLKLRDILPGDGVQPPEIKLPQGYANCDNCSPDIFRCTLNKFPSSKNLLDKSRLPLGILIHPYKDLSRLTVIQCETITRCRNCRSYINPFVQFVDNAHWKCNLCYRVNELPGEFQIDPYTKTLGDPSRRPEIQNATIEYIASQDYMVRPPQPALYLFLLDVSRTATLTGYLEIVCDRILNKIMTDDIPGDSRTNIGFITYDSSVHFYQISNCDGGQPKQLIVSDISDIFLPLPDGLMVNLEENKPAIRNLLTSLPSLYRESYNTDCALGAALQAAFKILAPRGGRITVFQSCLPNCGPGNLEPRDDGTSHTGDRVQHMAPSIDFYKKLALECSTEQIAVDMFFISSQYLDIATVSGISKYSAGCIHNFSQFNVKSPTIVTRFINCFDRYLSRKIGFEALLRLRCTRGVAIHSFHGNFFVRSSDLLMLPNINPDNAYGMQLSIEDSLDGVSVVCFQAALLYTSSNAERRIRVHTLCIPVTDNLNDVFHNADQQAITCLIAKMAVDRSTEKSLSDAREAFFNAITDSLSAFKLGCSSYSGSGTLLSPLSLKVFPLYILATLKHTAFRTNQPTRLDERMFSMCQMKSLPLYSLIQYIYPDLYPIHSLEEQPKIDYEKLTEIPLPPVLQLSAERVESNGIYLMDDSETLTIFVGSKCSDQLIQKIFGYVNVSSMPEMITTLLEVDSKPSYLLRNFISYIQNFKPFRLPIEIIKDNGPHKLRFYSRLVEDKFESSLSYYEFLQRLSQQVR